MPRLPRDFPSIEPGSNAIYDIDFGLQGPAGVSLSGVIWTLSLSAPGRVRAGYRPDPTPWARLSGMPTIAGTITGQRVVGLYDGNIYRAAAFATLSDGEQIELWALLECRAPGS